MFRLSLSIARYLLSNEFTDGPGQWPGWYSGVTSMYSSEIAVNDLVEKVIVDGKKLDYFSTSSNTILNHPHIH